MESLTFEASVACSGNNPTCQMHCLDGGDGGVWIPQLSGSALQINFVQITERGCLSPAISLAEVSPSFLRLSVHMEL